MSRIYSGAFVLFALLLAFAGTASAHVTVLPAETKQGSYEVFTVRVPTEKESATIRVELLFPEGVAISRVQPLAGWSYEFGTDAEGKKTSIVWTADGAGLADGEFGEFKLQGKVAEDAERLAWSAVQTYADGSAVEWAGGAESETPASVTKVQPGAGEADSHAAAAGHQASSASVDANSASGGSASGDGSLLGSPVFYISLAALGAGAIVLTLALKRRNQIA